MAVTHGSKAVFKIEDSAGTMQDLSAYLTSAGLQRSADTAETTTLGSTSKTYIPGLYDGTIPLEGRYDPAVDAIFAGILGLSRNWEYYPAGTATGSPKYTGTGIISSYEVSAGVGDAATISAEVQISGDVTRGTA